MAKLSTYKVTAVPETLAANAVYFVQAGSALEIHVTDKTGTAAYRGINKADVDSLISTAIAGVQNLVSVADIAARDALQPNRNTVALVMDATADETVNSGAATYFYDVTTTTWTKIAEYESLDVTVTWDSISGKPSSSVEQIDAAVAASHTHANQAVLDLLTADADGNLNYNGIAVAGAILLEEEAW